MKKLSLSIFSITFSPFLLTSCTPASIISKIEERVIDPSYLQIWNMGNSPFSSFYHMNGWYLQNQQINNALGTPLTYQDRFNKFQGGLVIDEEDQKNRTDITSTWFNSQDLHSWFNSEKTVFTCVFRDGKGASLFKEDVPKLSDNTGRIQWTTWNGERTHPLFPTQFNPDITKEYYVSPQDVINELILAFNPYQNTNDSNTLWSDEIMSYGGAIVDFLNELCGIDSKTSEIYNKDFDANVDSSGNKLDGDAQTTKAAYVNENLAVLITALVDGTYQVYDKQNNTLSSLRFGESKKNKIKIYHLDSNFVPSIIDYEIPDTSSKLNFDLSCATNCNFVKIGIGDTSFTNQNSFTTWTAPSPSDSPWYLQFNLGSTPKQYILELFDTGYVGILPDRAIDYSRPTISGVNYATLTTYKDALFCGPYSIEKFVPKQYIILNANSNFPSTIQGSFNGKIKKIKLLLTTKKTGTDSRYFFQANDINETFIEPTDTEGWNTFVGPNINKPKSNNISIHFNYNADFVQIIFFNFLYGSSENEYDLTKPENAAFAIPSVRAFIAFMVNRSWMGAYSASILDEQKGVRNDTFVYNSEIDGCVPSSTITNSVVINEEYKNIFPTYTFGEGGYFTKIISNINNFSCSEKPSSEQLNNYANYYKNNFEDGKKDFFNFNFFTGLNCWGDASCENYFSSVTNENDKTLLCDYLKAWKGWCDAGFATSANATLKKNALDDAVRALGKKVVSDLKTYLNIEKVTLSFLESGSNLLTTTPFLKKFLYSIENYKFSDGSYFISPITFKVTNTISKSDFKQKSKLFKHGMRTDAWNPDYQDPLNTFATFIPSGFFGSLMHIDTLKKYSSSSLSEPLKTLYSKLNTSYEEFVSFVQQAKQIANTEERYKKFIDAEISLIYKHNLCFLENMLGVVKCPTISFVNCELKYQNSFPRNFWILEQTSKLRTFHENQKQMIFIDFVCKNNDNNSKLVSETDFNNFVNTEWNSQWGEKPTFTEYSKQYIVDNKNLAEYNCFF